jgi:hypothetical protein
VTSCSSPGALILKRSSPSAGTATTPRGFSIVVTAPRRRSPTVQARDRAWREQPIGLRAILRRGMSDNLDLVRSIYANWERGDLGSAEWAHSEIEFDVIGVVPTDARTGLAGMAQGFRQLPSTWADCRADADEYRELDGGAFSC